MRMYESGELRALAETARHCAAHYQANAAAALHVGHGIDIDIARHHDRESRALVRIAEILEALADGPTPSPPARPLRLIVSRCVRTVPA